MDFFGTSVDLMNAKVANLRTRYRMGEKPINRFIFSLSFADCSLQWVVPSYDKNLDPAIVFKLMLEAFGSSSIRQIVLNKMETDEIEIEMECNGATSRLEILSRHDEDFEKEKNKEVKGNQEHYSVHSTSFFILSVLQKKIETIVEAFR